MVRSMPFSQAYTTQWGPQHQTLSRDQDALTLWMDRSSGTTYHIQTKSSLFSNAYVRFIVPIY